MMPLMFASPEGNGFCAACLLLTQSAHQTCSARECENVTQGSKMISYNPVIADSVVFTGHECNDEISSRFLVALRRYGRSQRMRSKQINYTELAFCLRNSHPQDFLTLFGKDFASLVMLRGGTSR